MSTVSESKFCIPKFGRLKTELCNRIREWGWVMRNYKVSSPYGNTRRQSQVDEPGHVLSESKRLLCWRSNLKFLPCLKTCLHHAWMHAEIIFLDILTPCFTTCLSFAWIHVYEMFEKFEGMQTRCLKTCLTNDLKDVYWTWFNCLGWYKMIQNHLKGSTQFNIFKMCLRNLDFV